MVNVLEWVKVQFNGNKYKKELEESLSKYKELEDKVEREGLKEVWELRYEKEELERETDYLEKANKKTKEKLAHIREELDIHITSKELTKEIKVKKADLSVLLEELGIVKDIKLLRKERSSLKRKVAELKEETIYWEGIVEDENNGVYVRPEDLYESRYYTEELKNNRTLQREMKKRKTATIAKEWIVGGSVKEGKKMTEANIKQILRSFDGESNTSLKMLTFKNYEVRTKALHKSYTNLNKIFEANGVEITDGYYKLKRQELDFAYKELVKKEEEKELLREQREIEKEEEKALKEIEKKKKVVDKDITHYDNMMGELKKQIKDLKDENKRLELEKEVEELESKKADKEAEKEELDFREENAKAGYVYIISNIGSFGEGMVKIGVTRRLNPYERIRELSSASVPFKFDVHAMVFSQDAFKLEAELHNKFSDRRVNLVNNRKEFFFVTIEELKEGLTDYKNLTLNFEEVPEAIEFRDSEKERKSKRKVA